MDLHSNSNTSPAWPIRFRGAVPMADVPSGEGSGAGGSGGQPASGQQAPAGTPPGTPPVGQQAPGSPNLKERLQKDSSERRTRAEEQRNADAAERKAMADRIEALEKRLADSATKEAEREAATAKSARDGAVNALLDAAKVKTRFRTVALQELGDIGDPSKPEAKKKIDDWASKNADMTESAKVGPLGHNPPADPSKPAPNGRPRGADFMPIDMAAHRRRN